MKLKVKLKIKLRKTLVFSAFLGSAILPPRASPNEWIRPRSPFDFSEQSQVTAEEAVPVAGARVAWADYEALRRDFPPLREMSPEEINQWLLHNFSFVGAGQPGLNGIRNTPIPPSSASPVPAFRPKGWRRSAVLEARDPRDPPGEKPARPPLGLVDVKGFGWGAQPDSSGAGVEEQQLLARLSPEKIDQLRIRSHSDGLMSLGEGVAEIFRQKAAQRMFEKSGLGIETVESYALLALPFRILKENGASVPAGLYLRQAHEGRGQFLPIPSFFYSDYHGHHQRTDLDSAVDFGGVVLRDPELADHWGKLETTATGAPATGWDPQQTRPWAKGHELAEAFMRDPDPGIIENHLREMLSSLDAWIARHPEKFPPGASYLEIARRRGEWVASHRDLSFQDAKRAWLLNEAENTDWIRLALTDPEGPIRESARRALARRKEELHPPSPAKELPPSAPSPDTDQTVLAPTSRNDLMKALNSGIPQLEKDARLELSGRTDPESLSLIRGLLGRPSKVQLGFQILHDRADSGALALVRDLLMDPDPAFRSHVLAGALANRSDAGSAPLLAQLLHDPDRNVRSLAFNYLLQRSDPTALALARKALVEKTVRLDVHQEGRYWYELLRHEHESQKRSCLLQEATAHLR